MIPTVKLRPWMNYGYFVLTIIILTTIGPLFFANFYTHGDTTNKNLNTIIIAVFRVEDSWLTQIIALCTIVILRTLIAFQIGRALSGFLLIFLVLLWIISQCIEMLTKLRFDGVKNFRVIFLYSRLRVIIISSFSLLSSCNGLLVVLGLVVNVCANYVTIKLYNTIPFHVYLMFPILATMVPILISTILPHGVKYHEETEKLLSKWKMVIQFKNQKNLLTMNMKAKMVLKKLNAMKPVTLYFGVGSYNLIPLTNSFKSEYYMAIMEATVNAVLAF